MESLEKSMFFIPNRLHVHNDELYVSFNIAVIPEDMEVLRLSLQLTVPERVGSVSLTVHRIVSAWDEQSICETVPDIASDAVKVDVSQSDALHVDLTHMADDWRFQSEHNHGVYVRLHADTGEYANTEELANTEERTGFSEEQPGFSEEQPPYLLVDTV